MPESQTPSERLRAAVLADYDLDPVSAELLETACSVLDGIEALADAVALEGALVGGKVSPTVIELRQQRLLLSRLLGQLRLPDLGDLEEE